MYFNFVVNIAVFIADLMKEILLFKYIFSYNFKFSGKKAVLTEIVIFCMLPLSSIDCLIRYVSIVYMPFIYVIILVFLNEKEKRSAVYFFVSYICICQMDAFLSSLMKLIIPFALQDDQRRFLTALVSVGLVLILCEICKRFQLRLQNRRLNLFMFIQAIILCLIILLIGVVSNVVDTNSDIFYGKILVMTTCALSIMITLLGFVVYSAILSNRNYRELETMNEKYFEMQNKYYENIQRQNTEIRKFRHDMQSHFICLNYFLEQNEIQKATKYIKEMGHDLEKTKMGFDVGYEVASVILNTKKEDLEKYGIKLSVIGNLPSHMTISDYDFCSIFSNLINNAIEACQLVDGQRNINIILGGYNKYVSLRIVNSCVNKINLRTSKIDVENHGFGILKIKECVERYDGDMKIEKKNGFFSVDILLKCI